jgi:hypothetical protein
MDPFMSLPCADALPLPYQMWNKEEGPMTEHSQVLLPELGFTVDEGLEELIELCWKRGLATGNSCIGGNSVSDDARGHFTLVNDWFAMRWEALTGYPVTWCDEGEEKYPAIFFHRYEIPELVAALRAGWMRTSPLQTLDQRNSAANERLAELNRRADAGEHVDYAAELGWARW